MNTNDQAGRAVHLPDKRTEATRACGRIIWCRYRGGAPLDETSGRDRSWRQARFRGLLPRCCLPLIEVERAAIPPASLVGAVAQLGERLNGIQEVRGSIPLGSTSDIKYLWDSWRDF
jgi:hypothetical protein